MDAPPPAQPDAAASPPSSTSASAPPFAPPTNSTPSASMAAPPTSESTPAPTPTPAPTSGPVQTLETPTPNATGARPPPPRMRPPYGNLAAPIALSQSAATTAATSSSASVPASSVASAMPRAVTIGLPAQPRGAPVGYSGFLPPPPLSQQFGSMHRGPDQTPQSSAQLRQTAPGIQNIGMIGSLNASQMRPPAISGPQPPRPGLPSSTSSPSGSQMPVSLKTPVHALTRPLSATAPSTASPQNQSNASSPFRPQQRSQIPQPRPHHVPQSAPAASHQQNILSLQQQLSQNQLVRQQQQHSQSQQSSQQNATHKNQQQISQQQAPRIPVSMAQKSDSPATLQASYIQLVDMASINADAGESGNRLLSKRSIHDLVAQIDPSEQLDPEVEDVLIDIAEDFVESVATFACSLAKHRKSNTLEAKDVLLHAERSWNITLPGFGGDEIKLYKKPHVNDIHRERLTLIKKSMASEGNTKSSAAQASANQKNQTPKPPAPGSP